METAVAWATIIGTAANVAMAVAAGFALSAWRKQIAGASDHELAKKLSGALRQVAIVRTSTLDNLRWYREQHQQNPAATLTVFARQNLEDDSEQLSAAINELRALEGQVAVQWGDKLLALVDLIRSESLGLYLVATIELRPDLQATPAGQYLSSTASQIAPSVTGPAFKRGLDEYTRLAQSWLGVHVGREGAKRMGSDELDAQRARIDLEIERIAETERQAFARTATAGRDVSNAVAAAAPAASTKP